MTRIAYEDKHYPGALLSDPNSSHSKILSLIGGGRKVLDLGCGDGALARALRAIDCSVTGVELNAKVAAAAAGSCDRVIIADLDLVPVAPMMQGETFDVVVFADVLEHLRNPWRVLSGAHQLLNPDGYVVASIPNVAHGAVRLALLQGRFDYVPLGILDNTHLRFFTRAGVEQLFRDTGYAVETMDRTVLEVGQPNADLVPPVDLSAFSPETVAAVVGDEDAHTVQFIVQARPLAAFVAEPDFDRVAKTVTQLAILRPEDAHRELTAELARVKHEADLTRERLEAALREVESGSSSLCAAQEEVAELTARLSDEERARAEAEELLAAAKAEAVRAGELVELMSHWETRAHEAEQRADAAQARVAQLRRELVQAQDAERAAAVENRMARVLLDSELRSTRSTLEELKRQIARSTQAEIELAQRVNAESHRLQAESAALELQISAIVNGPVGRLRRRLRGG